MQLPLSASALVMLGVAAVLIGASILVLVAVRKRKPASGTTRLPPDVRMHQRSVPEQRPAAMPEPPAVDDRAARPHVPAPLTYQAAAAAPVEPALRPPVAAEKPAPTGFAPEPLAGGAVAAAATARPTEVAARVDPPGRPDRGEPVSPDQVPVAPPGQQAGSARTVAAAVAQAFAVRAAAGRAGAAGQGTHRPPEPPWAGEPPVTGTQENTAPEPSPWAEGGASAPALAPDGGGTTGVTDAEPGRDEQAAIADAGPQGPEQALAADGGHVPVPGVDGGDPAAATDPDGLADGLSMFAAAEPGPGDEHRTPEPDAPGMGAGGNGQAVTAGHGAQGDGPAEVSDHAPDGNGQPTGGAPGTDGDVREPVSTGSALPATGWIAPAMPAATAEADPEPAAVPHPEHDGAIQQGGSPSDARDRLLAVLLDDPERAVGAAVELEACLVELGRLSDSVRRERAELRDLLHRLRAAGLRPEQLARLAGMPLAEVEGLLEAAPAQQA